MIFAEAASSDTPVVVGAFVTIIAAFLGVAKIMLSQATKDREADRNERLKLTLAIEHMADNSTKVAQATDRSANEAKQRNGHLAELVLQGNQLTKQVVTELQTAGIKVEAVKVALENSTTEQHIETQIVDRQVVDTKESR